MFYRAIARMAANDFTSPRHEMSDKRQWTHPSLEEIKLIGFKWAPFVRTKVQIALALREESHWHLCFALTAFSNAAPPADIPAPLDFETKSIRAFRKVTTLADGAAAQDIQDTLEDP